MPISTPRMSQPTQIEADHELNEPTSSLNSSSAQTNGQTVYNQDLGTTIL